MAFRFTSPSLRPEDQILRECPVGAILRTGDHVYDAINAFHLSEKSGVEFLSAPLWFQRACGVIAGEKARLSDMAEADRKSQRDAQYGKRQLGIGHGRNR